MKCPKCGGKLKVTHAYQVERDRTQRVACQDCKVAYTAHTVLVDATHGNGAKAAAKRIREGRPPFDDRPSG